MESLQGLAGIPALLALAWLLSEDRRGVALRPILLGLAVQLALVIALLRFDPIREVLLLANHLVLAVEAATQAGTSFVFGYLGGDAPPFEVTEPDRLYILAFRLLPQILIFSVLVAVLWYWRVVPLVIAGFAWVLRRTLGVGGAIGVAASSSVFLGMVESPLVIRAYLAHLTRSELFLVLTCGMSTVAGSVMVLYATVLGPVIDGALGHILIASVINVVGAIIVARIMIPDTAATGSAGESEGGDVAKALEYHSTMDAITRGTGDGVQLVINVGAMLIVLVSLVALVNGVLGAVELAGAPLSLERAMGWLFAPVAWLIGIPWAEATQAGALLGMKLVLNELIAYLELAAVPAGELSAHSRLILTYALCGFANFGSLGIMIGGLSVLAPERRGELLSLAPRSLLSGTLVTCLTGAIVGLVLGI